MVLQLAEELSRGEEGGQVGPEGQKLLDFLQAMKVLRQKQARDARGVRPWPVRVSISLSAALAARELPFAFAACSSSGTPPAAPCRRRRFADRC